jgi:hypothetical protein
MAKAENIKIIEMHVEKLVLAVCLLALLLASWHWLFSSPTELEIYNASTGETALVSPMDADALILRSAEAVHKMYSGSKVDIPPVPAWVARLNEQRAISALPTTPTDLSLPRIPVGPVEPPIPEGQIGIADLIDAMPAPAKPVMMSSIELPNRLPLADVVLARGLSGYPLEALAATWKKMLKAVPFENVVPYKLIVEVQQAPADGDWSKAKSVLVETALMDAAGKPIAMPGIPDFDDKNIAEVRKARDAVLAMQQQILQPSYLPVWRADLQQWVQPELPALPEASTQPAGQTQATVAFFDDATRAIGSAYRYRVQLVVVNPLLTYPEALPKDRQDEARRKFLTSKPSQWSEPVSAHREVYFFLTGANSLATKMNMTVTVYARQWGQWTSKLFEVLPGEVIGGVEKVDLLDPMDKGKGRKSAEVDFSTGCVVLRLDFNKMLSRKGIGFGQTKTPELMYMDAQGKLQSRVKAWDDTSELRKELAEAVRKAATE